MSDDSIADALNLTPLVPTRTEIKAIKNSDDYVAAKGNMDNVIEVGTKAMSDLAEMASLSQDPRVYRVLTELLSAMTTANKEMMEIKAKEVEIKNKSQDPPSDRVVNQNLFVGSTAELFDLIQKKKET